MNQQIINLRAFAIIMVVLGHSIIIYDNTFELLTSDVRMPIFETLKHYISFIQMKLFISISGFLLAYRCIKEGKIWGGKKYINYLNKKVYRLLIPYIFVCFFWNNPIKIILGIPGFELDYNILLQQLIGNNCGHLWYLPCLFLLTALGYPFFCWARTNLTKHTILFALLLTLNYYHTKLPEVFQLQNVAYYFVFFHLGFIVNLLRTMKLEYIPKYQNKLHSVCILIMVSIVGYSIRCVTSIGFECYLSIVITLLLYVLMPSFKNNILDEISNRSYGLYLFHSPMIYITATLCPNINPWFMLVINFIVFGVIAYVITMWLSNSKLKFIIGQL